MDLLREAAGLVKLGRLDEAAALLERLLAHAPRDIILMQMLADVRLRQGLPDRAIALLKKASNQQPRSHSIQFAMAVALQMKGDLLGAERHCKKAIELKPSDAGARMLLGNICLSAGRFSQAVPAFEAAIERNGDLIDAHSNYAIALRACGRSRDALASLDKAACLADEAVKREPDGPDLVRRCYEAWIEVAHSGYEEGLATSASQAFRRAAELRPNDAHALLGDCVTRIPVVCRDDEEVRASRADYVTALQKLIEGVGTTVSAHEMAAAVGVIQPFYLAYQGQNDAPLQALYGGLLSKTLALAVPQPKMVAQRRSRPRVGIISGFFRDHPVWKVLLQSWMRWLERSKFEIIGYYTGVTRDAQTEAAARLCDRFEAGPRSRHGWAETIREDGLDVILYPEIGMDPIVPYLAAQRLAPVQLASWGHPITTGLPTIDAFISNQAMEPPDAQDHYTEQLITLPGIGFTPFVPQPGLDQTSAASPFVPAANEIVYWCGHHYAKFRPEDDDVFPRIAREVPRAKFVFTMRPNGLRGLETFTQRLRRSFEAFGLSDATHCVWLPYQNMDSYWAVLRQSHVFLDSIGFSGLTTTLDAVACDLPIVTLQGNFMRGRQSTALLSRLGLSDQTNHDKSAFIAHAASLGKDKKARADFSSRMRAAKEKFYLDQPETIDALTSHLECWAAS